MRENIYHQIFKSYMRISEAMNLALIPLEGDSSPIRPNNMRSGIGGSILIQKFYLK